VERSAPAKISMPTTRLIECALRYNKSAHLQQLYAGFVRLQAAGVIDLQIDTQVSRSELSHLPILYATINGSVAVVYDALDGLNWVPGTIEDNLRFFQTTVKADYYFKRSFNQQVATMGPLGCKVLPLGFNYHVRPHCALVRPSPTERLRDIVRRNELASNLLRSNNDDMALPAEDYEHHPILDKDAKILLLTRLWNPADFDRGETKAHIEALNESRISAVTVCRKEFGERFCGGLSDSHFSRKLAKSLIAPLSLTNKKRYLKLVKSHAICIGTNGLHGSVGWKFGEYVAASRAIVSEPLLYEVPGDFRKEQNYSEFTNVDGLIAGISALLRDRSALLAMMQQNYRYYNSFLKPESLVLNTLLKATEGKERYRVAAGGAAR
jgi:hypothetical protein